MGALSPAQMVAIWERGRALPDWARALEILREDAAGPSGRDPTRLTLGERNARLFALRRDSIGPVMRAFVKCPNCGEPLEFEQAIDELIGQTLPATAAFAFEADGYALECRLPDSTDLAFAAGLFFEDEVVEAMVDRALVSAGRAGEFTPAGRLPMVLRERIASECAARDPLAHPAISLGCAACGHVWKAPFDIAAFFWTEIERAVRSTLDDVIALARGYGWQEGEILAMSAARRQFYLEALE